MNQRYFVASTDIEVGKTVLSALLCAALEALYWKPIQTGTLDGTDRQTVMRLTGVGEDRILREVYSFVPPVSPHLAARWAGVQINFDQVRIPPGVENESLIVEGPGGVLEPLNDQQFVLDLIAKLKLPAILAARSSLGTINHTLLSLAALRSADVPVQGVVLIGDSNKDYRETIERYGRVQVIGEIPRLPVLNRAVLIQVFESHFDRSAFAG
jgi:dethiobiotin synthase